MVIDLESEQSKYSNSLLTVIDDFFTKTIVKLEYDSSSEKFLEPAIHELISDNDKLMDCYHLHGQILLAMQEKTMIINSDY